MVEGEFPAVLVTPEQEPGGSRLQGPLLGPDVNETAPAFTAA
jgi:hypothetical protein